MNKQIISFIVPKDSYFRTIWYHVEQNKGFCQIFWRLINAIIAFIAMWMGLNGNTISPN